MTSTPHDALFKAVFSRIDHARAALQSMLPPPVATRIDFSALALRPGSFVDEKLAGKLLRQLLVAAGPEAQEEIVSVADYLHEQGRRKGRREGLDEGRLEGRRSSLRKLLELRFGPLPEVTARRVQKADAQLLDRWLEHILTASTLDEALSER